jgi:hypothetical protein
VFWGLVNLTTQPAEKARRTWQVGKRAYGAYRQDFAAGYARRVALGRVMRMGNAIRKKNRPAAQPAKARRVAPLKAELRATPRTAEQLVAPHEWELLIRGFDCDARPGRAPGDETPATSDQLWERLSTTRYIGRRPSTPRQEPPLAQRPSA